MVVLERVGSQLIVSPLPTSLVVVVVRSAQVVLNGQLLRPAADWLTGWLRIQSCSQQPVSQSRESCTGAFLY